MNQSEIEIPQFENNSKFHPFLGCPICKKLKMVETFVENGKDSKGNMTSKKALVCKECGQTIT